MNTFLSSFYCLNQSERNDKAIFILRVVAGVIFIVSGWGKLTGNPSIEMFAGTIGGLGFPFPTFFALLAALTEFLGGIALILGIFVRPAGALLTIVMLVAFGMVHKFGFPAGEFAFTLLGVVVALMVSGPGHISLAHKVIGDECCNANTFATEADAPLVCCADKELNTEIEQICCNDSGQGCCGGTEHSC